MAQIQELYDRFTSETVYPVTTPQAVYGLDNLLTQKVDKIPGKGLSTNDYDNASKTKLDNLPSRDTLNASLGAKQNTLQPSSDITPDPRTNQLSLTRSAKMALFIDQWNTACGTYGRYDPDNAPDPEHPFYLNELWLTYDEALSCKQCSLPFVGSAEKWYYHSYPRCKTFLPFRVGGIHKSYSYAFSYCSDLEVIRMDCGYGPGDRITSAEYTFAYCGRLRRILGALDITRCTTTSSTENCFINCNSLEEVTIRGLCTNISFKQSSLISYNSFDYLITNAANTSAITITVHPDVYAKLIGDTTNAAAAALTPEELAQWQQILTAAAEKQITFATV